MGLKSAVKIVLKKCFNIGPEDIEDYRKRGVKIGKNPGLYNCQLDYGHGYLIEIGDNAKFAHVTILTHDASSKNALGYSKIARVKIGNDVFIGHGSIILPGTTIGDRVVIGAGSVVKGDIPSDSVAVGNPAKVVCTYDKYVENNRERMKNSPVYDVPWDKKTSDDIMKIKQDLADGTIGFDV
ncbi:MAG: acyltransferase [Lachnospiraceae bacterium]|nr:acyltransferase [Lachnospiraceae bacterium]